MKAVENLKIFILKQISDIKTYGITELVRKFYLFIFQKMVVHSWKVYYSEKTKRY